ncbi:hypothetical protein B0H10DRAFT_2209255 [Mycena sp. CBHHK59/15]|nr:hypothetical protein B0H10DRAFT_2209255 [Mycena sp. CBHHK59/15]
MKAIGGRRLGRRGGHNSSGARLATNVPKYTVTFHTDMTAPESHERYVANAESGPQPTFLNFPADVPQDDAPSLPLLFGALDEPAGAVPAYETTTACDEEAAKKRQNVAHMDELKAEEAVFLRMLLGLHHHSQLLTPCACGVESRIRKVACRDCVQPELLCRQCWVNKHRTMPTHWAFIWNAQDRFFEKSEFCRVLKNSAVALGHYGERCVDAAPARTFTLVESNGIHATAIKFCGCKTVKTVDGMRPAPDFQQLLGAGIFPGSVKEPKTGYTLGVLEAYREERNQGKGSAYDFVRVLQRKADPFFAGAVPDIYVNFLPVSRFHQYLEVVMRRGQVHRVDVPLPGELDRPYPNRPIGFLGLNCGHHFTLDGNFKANLFFKRDNGSDRALTDSNMYFPRQEEFDKIAKEYVVPDEDKEVPCNSHIGSIRNQGTKYGNTAISGVVAGACDHAVAGSFIDIPKGEAFALGTYATRELLRPTNSPPQPRACRGSLVGSYDSYCAFEVNQLKRAGRFRRIILTDTDRIANAFGSLSILRVGAFPRGDGGDAVGVPQPSWSFDASNDCRGRHDIISFVMDTWNMWKVLRQAELLAAERLDALKLFELHMAMVVDLSRQHATETHGIALLGSHRKHPLQETWTSITTLRDSLNLNLKTFRERQREIYPRLTLSALDLDEPELTAIQLPSYRMKHGQRPASGGVADDEDSQLREREITLRFKKARGDDYRGQVGVTRSQRNLQKAELMKDFRIAMYNKARAALIHMGHMAEDDTEPFAPLGAGTLAGRIRTYIGQRGTRGSSMEQLGHMLKSPRVHKRLKDIAPDDVLVEPVSSEAEDSDDLEVSPSKLAKERRGKGKGKPKKSDGWIWLEKMTRGQTPGDETKLAEYKAESDRVQWFRAEAEMYRWLEAYERKHAELMRVDARFSRDNIVWTGLADREEADNGQNGAVSFARMHAAMYKRLAHNAKVIFKSADSGAHHDWATATTLDELVIKVDRWRDVVFKWMDDMGIHRAYKDF